MKILLVPTLSLRLLISSLSFTTVIVGSTYGSHLNASDAKQFLTNHVKQVSEYMGFAKNWLSSFFNKNNNRSYDEQIKEFKEHLDRVEQEIVQQINGVVKTVPASDEYHAMLKEMHVITHDVKSIIAQIYKVLHANRTEKSRIFMGQSFNALNISMNEQLKVVKQRLCGVYEKARRVNAPFANELESLIRDIDAMLVQKIAPNEALEICGQLIKCQKKS